MLHAKRSVLLAADAGVLFNLLSNSELFHLLQFKRTAFQRIGNHCSSSQGPYIPANFKTNWKKEMFWKQRRYLALSSSPSQPENKRHLGVFFSLNAYCYRQHSSLCESFLFFCQKSFVDSTLTNLLRKLSANSFFKTNLFFSTPSKLGEKNSKKKTEKCTVNINWGFSVYSRHDK